MKRLRQILAIVSLVWASWLLMMLVHEFGHMLGAWTTAGTVKRVVWHPFTFSRTEVFPNPSPLIVVWGGPVLGTLIPMLIAVCARLGKNAWAYIFDFYAGFCGLANGVYIGSGAIDPVGDAVEMLRLGTPAVVMFLFGVVAFVLGLWRLNLASHSLGFGNDRVFPSGRATAWLIAAAAAVTLISSWTSVS